jgi:hypothetical protein
MIKKEIKHLERSLKGRERGLFNAIFNNWFVCESIELRLEKLGLSLNTPSIETISIDKSSDVTIEILRYLTFLNYYLIELIDISQTSKNDNYSKLLKCIKSQIVVYSQLHLTLLARLIADED